MNAGVDVPQIQRFGALYIASARLKSMSKWRAIIAAVDIGNPLFYLIAVGIGIGVLVEQGSGTSGTNGIKYIAFIAPALLANTAITGVMDETVFPTIEGFKWRKLFFAQNSTPITGRQIAVGVYLAALCRAIFSVAMYYILLLAFNVVDFGVSVLLLPIAVLGGGAFGAIILFAAAKIEKEGAVQTAIRIGMPLFNKSNKEFIDFQILQTILGDYFGSRLMSNIREDKGYTYGIGSAILESYLAGSFIIATEVGSEFVNDTLNEIKKEIERLSNEIIPEDELNLVRNYLLGQLLKSADGPNSLMDLYLGVDMHGLNLDYYNDVIYRINTISSEELKKLAKKYLKWNNLSIITAGKK